ncbi:P-loop NTPase fold protein [Kordiimonas sp. SCSIO 12610]|uniref:P-loop NTPase fold protein n=1 Tax=Kordiimonas sp. SCSIO 12610 TaxID=2829597 RepID=UPI00210EBCDA|nr:P-loop NTPase fold protein [Kordiimonas sp. SCSIO 12610]UTW56136.1 hypothetical protein KFF44_04365 [Kordiimonas sp. SCSIO 12610]
MAVERKSKTATKKTVQTKKKASQTATKRARRSETEASTKTVTPQKKESQHESLQSQTDTLPNLNIIITDRTNARANNYCSVALIDLQTIDAIESDNHIINNLGITKYDITHESLKTPLSGDDALLIEDTFILSEASIHSPPIDRILGTISIMQSGNDPSIPTCIDDYTYWPDPRSNREYGHDAKQSFESFIYSLLEFKFAYDIELHIHTQPYTNQDSVEKLITYIQEREWPNFNTINIDDQTHNKTRTNLESDQPSIEDHLGFQQLANSLGAFLKNKSTSLPLTVAVDGPWGSGKSSLMLMLREAIDPQYDSKEDSKSFGFWLQVWRSILLFYLTTEWIWVGLFAVTSFLITRGVYSAEAFGLDLGFQYQFQFNILWGLYGILGTTTTLSILHHAALLENRRRIKKNSTRTFSSVFVNAWRHGHGTRLKAAIMKRIIDQLIEAHGLRFFLNLQLSRFNKLALLNALFMGAIKHNITLFIMLCTSVWLVLDATKGTELNITNLSETITALILPAVPLLAKLLDKGRSVDVKNFITSPNYDELAGPDDEIEADFERIMAALQRENLSLAIFIDDLDRCAPQTVHEVVEALNVFFGKYNTNCLFVLGMHKEMVATALEVAYEKMAAKLDDNPLLTEQTPYGHRFLEKIVQFSVQVPNPTEESTNTYIEVLTTGSSMSEARQLLKERKHYQVYNRLTAKSSILKDWIPLTFTLIRLGPLSNYLIEQIMKILNIPDPRIWIRVENKIRARKQQDANFAAAIELIETEDNQETKRLDAAANFNEGDASIQEIFSDVRHALKSNPRQYKRFFNLFRFRQFIADNDEALSDIIKKKNDAILSVIELEYRAVYQFALLDTHDSHENSEQRRTEVILGRIESAMASASAYTPQYKEAEDKNGNIIMDQRVLIPKTFEDEVKDTLATDAKLRELMWMVEFSG